MYQRQIEMNNESSKLMSQLILKSDIQLEFINFINNEFKDILTDESVKSQESEDKERKLRTYLMSKPVRSIKKNAILEEFPDIPDLKLMTLSAIIEKYRR